ncbi:hypothetical protein [Rhizorhabdus histidinilytica]|uniref:hypothetical protein n=1 Tax=Rhizorhabdus histidinilytica TaxID=439228 RepID=UPI00321F9754
MADDIQFVSVEIIWARDLDDRQPHWLINVICSDGSEVVLDDKRSHASAVVAALEYGLPITNFASAAG